MINKVILIGNMGNDPEVQTLQSGSVVAKFSIATSEKYTNKAGEKVEDTEWHNIVAWGKLAEIVQSYFKKGSQVYIEGKITHDKVEKDGKTFYYTNIVARTAKILGRKSEGSGFGQPAESLQEPSSISNQQFDDLPF